MPRKQLDCKNGYILDMEIVITDWFSSTFILQSISESISKHFCRNLKIFFWFFYPIRLCIRPGQFPRNAGNHGNDRKFHKSHQILNQIKRNINELCLGKISCQKAVRIKFLWTLHFWICSMAKNKNPEMPEINRKLSKSKKHTLLMVYCY